MARRLSSLHSSEHNDALSQNVSLSCQQTGAMLRNGPLQGREPQTVLCIRRGFDAIRPDGKLLLPSSSRSSFRRGIAAVLSSREGPCWH